jgi:hypothetical protein
MREGYRFDFLNRDGSVDTFELGQPGDDGDAALRARAAMLVSLTAVAVEVWKDGEKLCRVRRDSNLAPPARQALASPHVAPLSASRPADGDFPPAAAAASA